MKVGQEIKKRREQKRLSQQEVADILNISQATYSNIESNKSNLSFAHLQELSALLEFDILEFLQTQGIIINQNDFKDNSKAENFVTHQNSEKLILQYEARIKEMQEIIALL